MVSCCSSHRKLIWLVPWWLWFSFSRWEDGGPVKENNFPIIGKRDSRELRRENRSFWLCPFTKASPSRTYVTAELFPGDHRKWPAMTYNRENKILRHCKSWVKRCGGWEKEKLLKETLTASLTCRCSWEGPGPQSLIRQRKKLDHIAGSQRLLLRVLVRAEGATLGNISPHALPWPL